MRRVTGDWPPRLFACREQVQSLRRCAWLWFCLGIPVAIHKEHKVYVPELIFGHLLTSDNYDDEEQRVTGGRNGFGAKLTNIFSKEFSVECADSHRKLWVSLQRSPRPFAGKTLQKIKPETRRFCAQTLSHEMDFQHDSQNRSASHLLLRSLGLCKSFLQTRPHQIQHDFVSCASRRKAGLSDAVS